jgi:hypothetical protein
MVVSPSLIRGSRVGLLWFRQRIAGRHKVRLLDLSFQICILEILQRGFDSFNGEAQSILFLLLIEPDQMNEELLDRRGASAVPVPTRFEGFER